MVLDRLNDLEDVRIRFEPKVQKLSDVSEFVRFFKLV